MTSTAWLLALAAAFFYGLALVLTQFGLRRLPPLGGASISVPTAAALFLMLAPFVIDFSRFDPLAAGVFAVVGLLFPGTVTLLTFAGNVHMGPNITGAVGNLSPLFAVALAVVLLGEPLGPTLAIGMAVVLFGVTLLTFSRGQATASWPLWAISLPLAGAAVRGVTQPAVKWGLAVWADPLAAVTIGYLMSAAVLLTVARVRGRAHTGYRDRVSICWFVAVGICNGVAVMLTYAALAVGDVSLVSPLIAAYPVVTLVISALIVRSVEWDGRMAFGVLATVAGVAIILAG
jgi:drug/metabolite transporter (DMT)-like permease